MWPVKGHLKNQTPCPTNVFLVVHRFITRTCPAFYFSSPCRLTCYSNTHLISMYEPLTLPDSAINLQHPASTYFDFFCALFRFLLLLYLLYHTVFVFFATLPLAVFPFIPIPTPIQDDCKRRPTTMRAARRHWVNPILSYVRSAM